MRIFLIAIFVFAGATSSSLAQFFAEGDLGFARYRSDGLQRVGVTPGGLNLSLAGGYMLHPMFGIEAIYGTMRTKASVLYEFLQQYLNYDNNYYGIGARIFLQSFVLRIGYAFHSITPYNTDFATGEQVLNNNASRFYGTDNKTYSSNGVYYGFIVEAFEVGSNGAIGIGSTLYNLSESGSNFFSFNLGFRYNFGAKSSGGGK